MSLKTVVIFAFLGCVILSAELAHSAPKGKPISTPSTPEKDAITFRDIPLGSSESILKGKFPEFDCANATANYPLADRTCRASTESEIYKCEIAFAGGKIGKMDLIECQIAAEALVATKARVYGGASASVIANYINDALVRVDISIALISYQSIMEALITKYGKPARVTKQEVRNRMGAKFEDEESTWKAGGVTLNLQKYGYDLTKSLVTYILDSSVPEVNDRMKKRTSESAKSL